MKLSIIFDERRIEKYDPLIKELERQKIDDYEIFPCIMRPNVVASINASHKMIVRMAMEKGDKEVCIAEDDLWFPADDGWQYFLNNKPCEYDLYLAATYILPVSSNMLCGFHLYCVHERFYEKYLSVPDDAHIDTAMDKLKGDYKICYPFAALQRAGFSSNNMTIVNYNSMLDKKDVYGEFKT